MKPQHKHVDLYSEFCPASSATVIGAGVLTITMGSVIPGFALIAAGVGVGVLGPFAKNIHIFKKP